MMARQLLEKNTKNKNVATKSKLRNNMPKFEFVHSKDFEVKRVVFAGVKSVGKMQMLELKYDYPGGSQQPLRMQTPVMKTPRYGFNNWQPKEGDKVTEGTEV